MQFSNHEPVLEEEHVLFERFTTAIPVDFAQHRDQPKRCAWVSCCTRITEHHNLPSVLDPKSQPPIVPSRNILFLLIITLKRMEIAHSGSCFCARNDTFSLGHGRILALARSLRIASAHKLNIWSTKLTSTIDP